MIKTVMTRIRPDDLEWLRKRAAKNHRTAPEEISAIRELLNKQEKKIATEDK